MAVAAAHLLVDQLGSYFISLSDSEGQSEFRSFPDAAACSDHAAGKVYLALFEAGVLDTCSIFASKQRCSKPEGVNSIEKTLISIINCMSCHCFKTVVESFMSKSADESSRWRRRHALTFPAVNLKPPHPTHFTAFRNDY